MSDKVRCNNCHQYLEEGKEGGGGEEEGGEGEGRGRRGEGERESVILLRMA